MPLAPAVASKLPVLDGIPSFEAGVLHGFLDLPATIEPVDQALTLMAETTTSSRSSK